MGYIKPFEESTLKNIYIDKNVDSSWGDFKLSQYTYEAAKLLNSPITNFDPGLIAEKLGINLPELPKGFKYSVYAWAKNPYA